MPFTVISIFRSTSYHRQSTGLSHTIFILDKPSIIPAQFD